MIEYIELKNKQVYSTVKFTLSHSSSFTLQDRHQLISVDGLGPVAADVNTTPSATMNGVFFNSVRTNERNIVIKGRYFIYGSQTSAFNSLEGYRQNLMRTANVGSFVEVTIKSQNRFVTISGIVEAHETDYFSSETGFQISILCPDPRFKNIDPTIVESTLLRSLNGTQIYYKGTVPTGINVKAYYPETDDPGWQIYSAETLQSGYVIKKEMVSYHDQGYMSRPGFDPVYFEFDTNAGSKYARLYKTLPNVTTIDLKDYKNVMNYFAEYSNNQKGWHGKPIPWFTLVPGLGFKIWYQSSPEVGGNDLTRVEASWNTYYGEI